MKKNLMSLTLVTLMFLSACATTQMKSVKDSSFQKVYSKILISVEGNLKYKSETEEAIIKKFKSLSNTSFYSEYVIFPPLKEYSEKEINEKIIQEGIEAILLIRLVDKKNEQVTGYIPTYNTTYGAVGNYNVRLNTTSMQPYQVDLKTSVYRVQILDLKNNKPVWVADAETQGYDEKSMRDSLLAKATVNISKSGFLLPGNH